MNWTIKAAQAHGDFTVEINWADGSRSVVDFSSTVGKGGVFERMRDPDFFVARMRVGGEGDWLEWPGDLQFSADSLWYRSHPSEDIPEMAATR
jgi:hypothetical protein